MKTSWETFRRDSLTTLLRPGATVVDVGGGLRAVSGRGNRYDKKTAEQFGPLLSKLTYRILDPVPDYAPDIVGDIHAIPLPDNSVDGVICMAVLEHVEDPKRAMQEILRIIRPGGHAFMYVPFLYYYHAEVGYYKDYWRFTKDSLPLLATGFTQSAWAPVRGALETWVHLSPLGRFGFVRLCARFLDRVSGKMNSNQVSGYFGFLTK